MTDRNGIGKRGLFLAIAASAAMLTASFLFQPATPKLSGMGICFLSPGEWPLNALASWIANAAALALIAIGAALLNRHYNFIRSTEPVLPAMFLVLACSNVTTDWYLSASTIICGANLIILTLLFGCWKSRNATQELFVVATVISIGSMFQCAFLPFIIPALFSAVVMKALRIKELLAVAMGLLAPYWVALGMGLVPPGSLHVPQMGTVFSMPVLTPQTAVTAAAAATAAFLGLLLALNNGMKLFAGNSKVNAMNMAVSAMGLTAILGIVFDFPNMEAYLATLYFSLAVQIANLCALWNMRQEWVACFVPGAVYVCFFLAQL